jgi:hypothetical protein
VLSFLVQAESIATNDNKDTKSEKQIYWYLVADAVGAPESQNTKLSDLKLEKVPLFTSDDIVYYKLSHSFALTDQAYNKVRDLNIPVRGIPFVVCVGDRRAYLGSFWIEASSVRWTGITIMKPWRKENTEIRILPSISKPDLRDDSEFFDVIKKSNKMIIDK